jgi:predicted short-subunit dehydrogenase-like oxidoreductase (DUF2520 family)
VTSATGHAPLLIIGDGVVANALGAALAAGGHAPLRWSRRAGGSIPPAEIAIVAVRDAAIAEVAARLIAELPPGSTPPIFLHCAGALPAEAPFSALARRPRGVGLMHPFQSLTGASHPGDLEGVVFGVQGDAAGLAAAREIVGRLGGVPLVLEGDALGRYHAAAALTANHVLGLVDAAHELLRAAGLSASAASAALASLFSSTARNLERLGLPGALTGPIERGDVEVVRRHLDALGGFPGIARLYRETAGRVIALAEAKGRAGAAELAALRTLIGA